MVSLKFVAILTFKRRHSLSQINNIFQSGAGIFIGPLIYPRDFFLSVVHGRFE